MLIEVNFGLLTETGMNCTGNASLPFVQQEECALVHIVVNKDYSLFGGADKPPCFSKGVTIVKRLLL